MDVITVGRSAGGTRSVISVWMLGLTRPFARPEAASAAERDERGRSAVSSQSGSACPITQVGDDAQAVARAEQPAVGDALPGTAPTPNDASSQPATRGSASKRVTTSTGTPTKNAAQAASPTAKTRLQTRSSRSRTRKRSPRTIPPVARPRRTRAATRHEQRRRATRDRVRRGVDDEHRRRADGRDQDAGDEPARAAGSTGLPPWKSAFARLTSGSSSPSSSGTITFCAAKYGALNAPRTNATARSAPNESAPAQCRSGRSEHQRRADGVAERASSAGRRAGASSLPPGRPSSPSPASSAATTRLIRVAEPVVTSTNHGSASQVICEPVRRDDLGREQRQPVAEGGCLGGGSVRAESVQPRPVLLHDLAVELDPPALAQVLDDVPVDRALVRAAEPRDARAEREVDGAVDLLVEERVPHVPRDPGVAADPELAEPARALVGVEQLEEELLLVARPRRRRRARLEAEPDPGRARGPVYTAGNSENAITPSAESSTGLQKNSPPGMFAPPASTSAVRPARLSVRSVPAPTIRTSLGGVEAVRVPLHPLALGVPVEQAGAEEEVGERVVLMPASCASAGVGYWQPTHGALA